MRLTVSPPSCAERHEILEPKPPGTLWATPGLLRDCFTFTFNIEINHTVSKDKGLPQHAEVTEGVLGRLRSRIFLTFGTTRVVGRQPYAPAAFTPRRNPWYPYLEAESTPRQMVPSVTTEKNPH